MRCLSLKNLLEKLDLSLRQRIPVIHQTESSECGLASLAMISAHYGKSIDLISLRQQFNLSARGAALAGLTGMAAGWSVLRKCRAILPAWRWKPGPAAPSPGRRW